MENKNVNTQNSKSKTVLSVILKIVLTVVAGGLIFVVGTLGGLLMAGEDIHLYLTYVIGYLLPGLLIPLIWLKNRKKYLKLWLGVAVVCVAAVGVNVAVVKHNDAITVNTSVYQENYENQPDYYPFEADSNLVRLDSCSLQLTGKLPKADGDISVLPVYSAFVNAVYPETAEEFVDYDNSNQSSYEFLSQWGYTGVANKDKDIFFDVYPTKDGEVYAEPYGVDFAYTNIGTEALVFIVDKDNPIDDLTSEQVKAIFAGEITNWSELGGKNKKIEAYQSLEGSVSQKLMERFMGETPLMPAPTKMGYGNLYGWEEQTVWYRNKAGAIGFSCRYLVKDCEDIKLLSIDGAAPTEENIKNGSYSLVTPMYAVTREGDTDENLAKLLDWILSDEGQYIIEESGYLGLVSKYMD